jgi:uncharacterized protein (TIGR03435 family)
MKSTDLYGNRMPHFGRILDSKIAVAAVLLFAGLAKAQSPPSHPQFEVASIKPNSSGDERAMLKPFLGGRLTLENFSLRMLLGFAYQVMDFQISGGPGWMDSDRYDIAAKADVNTPPGQVIPLLQSLLEDRFQVKVHRETKELPIYALVVDRNGPKFEIPKDGDCTSFDPASQQPSPGQKPPTYCGTIRMGQSSMDGANISIEQIRSMLSNIMRRTVIDKTGLTGTFNVHLRWKPDESVPGLPELRGPITSGPDAPAPGSSGPSIFTALQEQLGLKLESEKGPVQMLIIDRAEKPSDN